MFGKAGGVQELMAVVGTYPRPHMNVEQEPQPSVLEPLEDHPKYQKVPYCWACRRHRA